MQAPRNGGLWPPVVILLLALFTWGAWQVMFVPLESGGVYPPYSSLRADPLGTKALFESLSELPGLTVSRLYKKRPLLDPEVMLFSLGVDALSFVSSPKTVLDEYEKLLQNGGRIVIAFVPTFTPRAPPKTAVLEERWHIRPEYQEAAGQERNSGIVPRKSALYFNPGPEWRVLALSDGAATVVERDLARGTLVLVADSYPLSNQGLAESRNGTMIVTLVGAAHRVMFDENQFGVTETGSVAVLVRKYRLEGALAMLVAIFGLFVWRSASSFLPLRDDGGKESISGRDSHEGLAALLRRSVPETELLHACFMEWSRSAPKENRVGLVEAEINRWANRDPIEGYRAACHVLTERK